MLHNIDGSTTLAELATALNAKSASLELKWAGGEWRATITTDFAGFLLRSGSATNDHMVTAIQAAIATMGRV